jgi:hypothetical protein
MLGKEFGIIGRRSRRKQRRRILEFPLLPDSGNKASWSLISALNPGMTLEELEEDEEDDDAD